MWERVTSADIQQAKCEMADHHAEISARHARELRQLDTQLAFVEELGELIDAFVRRFRQGAGSPAERAAEGPAEFAPLSPLRAAV